MDKENNKGKEITEKKTSEIDRTKAELKLKLKKISPQIPDEDIPKILEIFQLEYEEIIQTSSSYSGPLPHPSHFSEYNKILPGSANRILSMAEKEQNHRHTISSNNTKSDIKNAKKGMIFAFILFLIGTVGGLVLTALGKNTGGLVSFLSTLGIGAGLFVFGRLSERKK